MTTNNQEERLDKYIDTLNAGTPSPPETDDADLADLFATARDLHRLRAAEPVRDDVPSRLAAALSRELRANPTHRTRRIESNDMSVFRDATSNGSIPPPDERGTDYPMPLRPERVRQWAQFAIAAAAVVAVGIILATIIGGGNYDEPGSAVGTDPSAMPTSEAGAPAVTTTPSPTISTPETTSTADPSDDMPDHDVSEGSRVDTFDDARSLVPFDLVEPEVVPASLDPAGIDVISDDLVQAYYRYGSSEMFVYFMQSSRTCRDSSSETIQYDDIQVGDVAIRRGLGTDAGGRPLASYRWQDEDNCLEVFASLMNGVDEQLLVSFVYAILAADYMAENPPGARIEPEFATLSVSPDYVTCADEVIARGTGFAPGTTVVIYGGPLPSDDYGLVSDDITVIHNGTFEARLNVSSIFAQCRGAEIDEDGVQYSLGADTGSTMTKGPVEGPSARTAITFSTTVPEAVKARRPYPSCGTEVVLNETTMRSQGTPDQAMRECFVDAVERGARAELATYRQTIEGDMVTYLYRANNDGSVELIVDSTRDRFGSGSWDVTTCTGASLAGESEGFEIQLAGCGDSMRIE